MHNLEIGQGVMDFKALSYSDADDGPSEFEPDSYVLILAERRPITFTSATDWTLRIEEGAWPALPSWAWPAESWRYEDVGSPIGSSGFDVIRGLSNVHNEVGEISGIEITFDSGTLKLTSGDSMTYELLTR
jgi:hypothetical protein